MNWVYASREMDTCCTILQLALTDVPIVTERLTIALHYAPSVLNYLRKNCARSIRDSDYYVKTMTRLLRQWVSTTDQMRSLRRSGEMVKELARFDAIQRRFVKKMWNIMPNSEDIDPMSGMGMLDGYVWYISYAATYGGATFETRDATFRDFIDDKDEDYDPVDDEEYDDPEDDEAEEVAEEAAEEIADEHARDDEHDTEMRLCHGWREPWLRTRAD